MQFPVRVLGDEHKSPPPWNEGFPKRGMLMPAVEVVSRWIVVLFHSGLEVGEGSTVSLALTAAAISSQADIKSSKEVLM